MKRLAVLFFVFAVGCVPRAVVRPGEPLPGPLPEPLQGRIVDAEGAAVPPEQLVEAFRDARYALLGERHDSACVHALQAEVLRLAAKSELAFAVGFEMVDVDFAGPMRAFSEGRIDVTALRHAVDWERHWGFDFWMYAPLLEGARNAGMPVVPLNLPARLRRGGENEPPVTQPELLAPLVLPPKEAQLGALRQVFAFHAEHGGGNDDDAFARFVHAQSRWDTQMAWAAREAARTSERVFLVVGAGHVENGWGIEHRLQTLDREARVVSFVPVFGNAAPNADEADFFFRCPAP